MILSPKESSEFIVKNAKFISVKTQGIEKLTQEVILSIQKNELDVEKFSQHDLHPKSTDKNAVNWIFLIDTLNFCFWSPGDESKWKVNNETGYYALCSAIKRAVDNGIDITNPEYYSKITMDELSKIFESDNGSVIPLLKERVQCLHDVGKKLIEKYNGQFENCVKESNNLAQVLLQKIVTDFPCFRDVAVYNEKKVSLYKRAQILIGDLWTCFAADGLGKFNDIESITMFADYRVPQVLVYFGSLEYSNELMALLKEDKILKNGSAEEVEIRGASIYIVEALKTSLISEIESKNLQIPTKNINSILLDYFLWDYRRRFAKDLEYIPFHKCMSIYY